MNWRLLSGLMWLVLAVGISGRMLYEERISRPEDKSTTEVKAQDRLLGNLDYRKDRRAANLELFGFSEDEAKRGVQKIREIEDEHKGRIQRFLEDGDDLDALADVFCGERVDLPTRYRALGWLVAEQNERRETILLGRAPAFEEQDWAATSGIAEVYRELELGEDRQPDATIMGIAAILVGKEEDVFNANAPWGQGIGGQWSWSRVKKEHRGIDGIVMTYLATMHLVTEIARQEGGLCDT
ncbi:MAG: hypothetical protein H6741_08670 [Alphaproteobacteria bacterium]|nr:hypothetical protein [Alphaproteobacteria bacterium]